MPRRDLQATVEPAAPPAAAAVSPAVPSGRAGGSPRWLAALCRLAARVFFGGIEVCAAAPVPPGRPTLLVANHNNGVVDALLLLAFAPVAPRFLGKSTLWKIVVLRPFLAAARVIPVSRRQDAGFDPGRNEESFRTCREALAAGGAVALFPEGKSHSEPALAELRTGAARILLGLSAPALAQAIVLPVGLLFDAPGSFRSRVLVRIGEPLPVQAALAASGAEARDDAAPVTDAAAVRALTDAIAGALRSVTLAYRSWDEARLLERAADLWLQPDPALPSRPPLADRIAARERVLSRYRELSAGRPERLRALTRALQEYDRLLATFGLRDEQVGSAYPLPGVLGFVARSALVLLVRLPLALVGAVLGYVPYRICGWAGSRVAHQPDMPATLQVLGGLLLFPLFWAAETALAGWRWGAAAALAVAVAAPLGGWAAVRFRDRSRALLTEARAYLLLRGPGRLGRELRGRRDQVRTELLALATEIGEPPPGA